MNTFLPAAFMEHVERLVLGIEPVDAQRRARVAHRIDVALDGPPAMDADATWEDAFGFPDPIGLRLSLPRHDSCRHALVFTSTVTSPLTMRSSAPPRRTLLLTPAVKSPVAIRIFDRSRRLVPRRLGYPIPANITVTTPPPTRIRRPALYPGAAYQTGPNATGIRGRVTLKQSNDVPARWVRVEARINGQVVGRAHGDDRGEFLLLLQSQAGGLGALQSSITAQVTVFGPAVPPALAPEDPLSDLPMEILVADPDDVSPGETLPTGYTDTPSSTRAVTFPLGTMLTDQEKFFFTV